MKKKKHSLTDWLHFHTDTNIRYGKLERLLPNAGTKNIHKIKWLPLEKYIFFCNNIQMSDYLNNLSPFSSLSSKTKLAAQMTK